MAFSECKYITVETEGRKITVTLNRPELHNAFNEDMIAEVTAAFTEIAGRDERVVILRGAGKSFCAGADLNWMKKMKDYTVAENEQDARGLDAMFFSIYTCPKPVIAMVQGGVYGGGTGILASADIVVTHKDTKFGFTEVKLGLVPAVISSYLVKRLNFWALREWLITGAFFGTGTAKEMGLVQYVEDGDAGMEERLASLLKALFVCGPSGIAETKNLVNYQLENDMEKRRDMAPKVIARARVSKEGQEGLTAFLEKRKASFVE